MYKKYLNSLLDSKTVVINMTGILMDSETGDIVLDENNNTIEVDDSRAFKQIVDGLLHCDVGSEIFNSEYGFDLTTAIRESYTLDSALLIESLIVQALDKKKEMLISSLDYIEAVRDGSDMNVTIVVTSILNDNVEISTNI